MNIQQHVFSNILSESKERTHLKMIKIKATKCNPQTYFYARQDCCKNKT